MPQIPNSIIKIITNSSPQLFSVVPSSSGSLQLPRNCNLHTTRCRPHILRHIIGLAATSCAPNAHQHTSCCTYQRTKKRKEIVNKARKTSDEIKEGATQKRSVKSLAVG